MAGRTEALTREDKRYEEIFSVERETQDAGHILIDDPYPAFAALRAQGPFTWAVSSRSLLVTPTRSTPVAAPITPR